LAGTRKVDLDNKASLHCTDDGKAGLVWRVAGTFIALMKGVLSGVFEIVGGLDEKQSCIDHHKSKDLRRQPEETSAAKKCPTLYV